MVLFPIKYWIKYWCFSRLNTGLNSGTFPDFSRVVLPYQKAAIQLILATIDQYQCYPSLVKYLKKLFINRNTHILNKIIYFMSINFIIIIKKGWQRKAEREWCTPYQSEDPSSTIPTYRQREENRKKSRRL